MAQYIDKDAVMAEIENLLDKGKYHEEFDCAYRDGNNGALYALKNKLNTLDVKDVDLEAEIAKYLGDDWKQDTPIEVQSDMIGYAKHFFALGLKTQKGE